MSTEGCIRIPARFMDTLDYTRPVTLAAFIYLISRGCYEGWQEVPMTELSKSLGVSRNTVNEGIGTLVERAYIEVQKGTNQHAPTLVRIVEPVCASCTVTCSKLQAEVMVLAPVESKQTVFDIAREMANAHVIDGAVSKREQAESDTLCLDLDLDLIGIGKGLGKGKGKRRKKVRPFQDDRIARLFTLWNEQEVVVHRAMTERIEKATAKVLAAYGLHMTQEDVYAEVARSIINYATCLKGPEYRWSYRWTLDEFMSRGVHRFLDEARPLEREREMGTRPTPGVATRGFSAGRDGSAYERV